MGDKTNPEHIVEIGGYLPMLERIEAICAEQCWHGEGMVCAGLTHMLAHLVESASVPDSPEYEAASKITAGDL